MRKVTEVIFNLSYHDVPRQWVLFSQFGLSKWHKFKPWRQNHVLTPGTFTFPHNKNSICHCIVPHTIDINGRIPHLLYDKMYHWWLVCMNAWQIHYSDVIIDTMVSQITSLAIVCFTVYSGADEIKHHSSASLAFVRGIHRWPLNSQCKGTVTQKMLPFDNVQKFLAKIKQYLRRENKANETQGRCIIMLRGIKICANAYAYRELKTMKRGIFRCVNLTN